MAENMFELVGRVGWKECKVSDKGTLFTKINLGCKKNKEEWNNFFITFIDSPDSKSKIAERLGDSVKVDDYVRIKGILSIDKFTPKDSVDNKPVEKISLIGRTFCAVKWDDFEKRFIDV